MHRLISSFAPRPVLAVFSALALLSGCDGGSQACDPCPQPTLIDDGPRAQWTSTPVEAFGQLRVDGNVLRSESGELVQLKGVSSMWLNWENDGYAENLDALAWMRDNWHVSVLRVAMGIEPAGAYLSNPERAEMQVRTIIENAIELGLYVLVDWHDHNALDNQAAAEDFFAMIARDYGDNPNILYETFNEPTQVQWSELKPYHEAVVARIRAEDPDNIIVLGTPTWCQDVDVAASDPVDDDNVMYTLHFYACTHQDQGKGSTAIARGLAVFVSEWGATHSDGGLDGIVCEDDADEWHDWMDKNAVSWTAWKLDGCTDSSCLFKNGTPIDGGFTDEWLQGHGPYVRARLLD